jgi:thioredoxin reductase/bacterioferritin-associated ferredoxin
VKDFDLIVIGAGPAGATAAAAASGEGLRVALIDEAVAPGGQIYRAPASGLVAGKPDADSRVGNALRERVTRSGASWFAERRVWSVSKGFRINTAGLHGPEVFTAPRLIAATGAHERIVPFPGWTLPGVIGLAAATVLIKSQGMLPGGRCVIAGCGPLLAAVAAKVAAGGGDIAAVVDLAGPLDWLKSVPPLLRRPRLLARGIGWVLELGLKRVPIYFHHTVLQATGECRMECVHIGRVDRNRVPVGSPGIAGIAIEADLLVVGHGLVPGAEIPRLLHADMTFDRRRGGWVPRTDGFGRCSLTGLYAVGDGAGLRGAEPSALAGELAGLAAAMDAKQGISDTLTGRSAALERQLQRYGPFADAVADMMALRRSHAGAISADTVVCRCEDVTRGEIDAAACDGAHDVNQLKHFTRCGMGPCQGRMCGDVAAELLALACNVSRETVGHWTGRPPLRPVPLEDLVGRFSYADIPVPKPAPL